MKYRQWTKTQCNTVKQTMEQRQCNSEIQKMDKDTMQHSETKDTAEHRQDGAQTRWSVNMLEHRTDGIQNAKRKKEPKKRNHRTTSSLQKCYVNNCRGKGKQGIRTFHRCYQNGKCPMPFKPTNFKPRPVACSTCAGKARKPGYLYEHLYILFTSNKLSTELTWPDLDLLVSVKRTSTLRRITQGSITKSVGLKVRSVCPC